MRAFFKAAALAAALIIAFAVPAVAADTAVTIPWGDWLSALLGEVAAVIGVVLAGILTFAASKLPPAVQAFVTRARIEQVEQLLARAIGYGLNSLGEAVKGKTLSVDVKNELIEQALQYAIDHGPAKLIAWMGGEEAIREKLIARLPT